MLSALRLAASLALTLALSPTLGSQSDKPADSSSSRTTESSDRTPPPPPATPRLAPRAYSLSITVKETEPGKEATEKSYTFNVVTDDNRFGYNSLRDGDHIPYMGEKGREYHTVGTNVDVRGASRLGDTLVITLAASDSTLASKSNGVDLPVTHDWSVQVTGVLVPGKPAVIYSATDASTGRKVEIASTAQLLGEK